MDRRDLLRLALAVAVEKLPAAAPPAGTASANKLVLVTLAGVRRRETFSARGLENVPHLHGDLLPRALFYENCDKRAPGV